MNAPARAALGGFMTGLLGMTLGMFLGTVIGVTAFGNNVRPPQRLDDPALDLLVKIMTPDRKFIKLVAGSIGFVVGGLVGAVGGSMFAAYSAAKTRREDSLVYKQRDFRAAEISLPNKVQP